MASEVFQWRSATPSKRGWLSGFIGLAGLAAVAALLAYGAPYLSSPRSVAPPKAADAAKPDRDPIARVLAEPAPKEAAKSAERPVTAKPVESAPPAAKAAGPAPPVTVLNERPEEQNASPGSDDVKPAPVAEAQGPARDAPEAAGAPAEKAAPKTAGEEVERPKARAGGESSRPRRTAFRPPPRDDAGPRGYRGRPAKDFRSLRESVLREALGGP